MRASATIFYLFARLALGSLLIAHALAHGVLALRGAVDWTPASIHGQLPAAAYCFAVVALFAAGLGVLGSSVFRRHAEWLFGAGLVASMTALVFNWNEAARWGLALDGFVLAAFMIARPTGIVVIGPAAPVDLRRWRLSRWVVEIVSCALVAYVAIATAGWPQYRQWGSTYAEQRMPLPGDPAVRALDAELMHAVIIDRPLSAADHEGRQRLDAARRVRTPAVGPRPAASVPDPVVTI